jgi:hypothetical protein
MRARSGSASDQPHVTEIRTWGAHEHISVNRASAEEDKR